jgi:hypothetical protein
VGVSRPTVLLWRDRFAEHGIDGLHDEARAGRPRHVSHKRIIAATLKPPPKSLGVIHWSSRLLDARLGVGNATIARCWRECGVQPWRSQTFKFSTDPELVAKVTDVIELDIATGNVTAAGAASPHGTRSPPSASSEFGSGLCETVT